MKGITHETLESHIRAVLASACAGNDDCLRGDTRRESGFGREACHFFAQPGETIHFSYDVPEDCVVTKEEWVWYLAIRMGMALLAVVLMAMNMVQLTLKQKRHDLFLGGN